jgi:uncharacterized protein YndB with AHSA1/START domain
MSPATSPSLRAEAVVPFPPIDVWQAFTHPVLLYYWLGDAVEIDLRVGGAYIVRGTNGVKLDATVERLVEGRRLVLRPTRSQDDDRLEIDFVKLAGAETRVTVSDPDLEAAALWRDALENLASVWEHGIDLREARRPLMGIGTRDLKPGDRPIRGVPPGAGVRLQAVLRGGAAEEAGLRAGDVVLAFDETMIPNENELIRCIRARRPGEAVPVRVVRDGEEHTRTVMLRGRPGRAEPPPDPDRLIRALSEDVQAGDTAVAKAVEGIKEADAYRPEGPGAWSVAQVLAHLSVTERMLQCWLDQAARGERPVIDSEQVTSSSRIAAALEGKPPVKELLDRLRRDERETLAYLGHLPSSVTSFKPRWARVVFIAQDYHAHSAEHLNQIARIRATIGV